MSVIDDLKILITADSRGIETVLKKTVQYVTGTVNQINKQEVNWTSIFSRSISPAIIASTASLFAFAIEQSLHFQEALNTTGTAAGQTTSQVAKVGQSAVALSKNVTSSAQDLANAEFQLSSIFSPSDAEKVALAMGQLADSGFGNLNDIVSASIQIFKEWGVTTSTDAVAVLTDLMHSAQGAKESIPVLASQFMQFSPQLIEAGMNLKDFNSILSAFGAELEILPTDQAIAVFSSLAEAASGADPKVAAVFGGLDKIRKSLKDDGGLNAIQTLANTFSSQWGNNAALIATNFGLSQSAVAGIIIDGRKFPQFSKDARDIGTSAQTINQAFKDSDSTLRSLLVDWNSFKASFLELMNGTLADQLSSSGLQKSFNSLVDPIYQGADKAKLMRAGIYSNLLNTTPQVGIGTSLQTSGLSAEAINKVLQQAESKNVVDQLLSALLGGVAGNTSNYNTLHNTFNLSVPSNKALTPQDVAAQLYQAFQGVAGPMH